MALPAPSHGFGGNPVASLLTGIAKGNVAKQREEQRRKEQAIQMALRRASLENQRQSTEIRREEHETLQEQRERERQEAGEAEEARRNLLRQQFPEMNPDEVDQMVTAGTDPFELRGKRQELESGEATLTGQRQQNAARGREMEQAQRVDELLEDPFFTDVFSEELGGQPITEDTREVLGGAQKAHGVDWSIDDVRRAQERLGGASGGPDPDAQRAEAVSNVANELVRQAGGSPSAALAEWRETAPRLIAEGEIGVQEADAVAREIEENSEGLEGDSDMSAVERRRQELQRESGSEGG